MSSVNKVILIGNLGKNPEERTFQNGGRIVNFSVATSDKWKDKSSGEMKEKTEWHNVVITDEHCARFAMNLVKGSKVYIEGKIETRKYTTKDGAEKYMTEVCVRPFGGVITALEPRGASVSQPTAEVEAELPLPSVNNEAPELDDSIPF